MGKFNVCILVALSKGPSYAWIALHRCVEANARLTGESFRLIFQRLEKAYGFRREHRSHWPSLSQIHAAAAQLQAERTAWLKEMNLLITKRRTEKKRGKRHLQDLRLKEMIEQQGSYFPPHVGVWGWKRRREGQ